MVWTDDDLDRLIDHYVAAARLAADVGFRFVDIKACHGYLLHEFLSARTRPGPFGGDLAGRTRLLRTIIQRVRDEAAAAVRAGAAECLRYAALRVGTGQSGSRWRGPSEDYPHGFGVNPEDPCRDRSERTDRA